MTSPRIVVAPDKFKGSLTAEEVATALSTGLRRELPEAVVVLLPLADGGDGSVAVAVVSGFEEHDVTVTGPAGEPITATIARRGDTVLVEVADICGLRRLPQGRLAPMTVGTRGVGEAIEAGVALGGVRQVVLALGGSASTDGGCGLLAALGLSLLDANGRVLSDGGGALPGLDRTEGRPLLPGDVDLVVATDVDNPLLGHEGAAYVFAPQKGADPDQVRVLDDGLRHFVEVLERSGSDATALAETPGAGAAGGLGFAGLVLGGRIVSGADYFMGLLQIEEQVATADLVVTGEGGLDRQSLGGKLPVAVAQISSRLGVPVVCVAGVSELDDDAARQAGFERVWALADLAEGTKDDPELSRSLLTRVGAEVAAYQASRGSAPLS